LSRAAFLYTPVPVYRIKLIFNLLLLGFEFLGRKSYNGIVDSISYAKIFEKTHYQ